MKKNKILIMVTAILVALTISCEEYMETTPLGVASDQVFNTEKGVNALLTGAYAAIDGAGIDPGWGGTYAWAASVTNWVWGSVCSDDAYKGTDVSDQTPINPLEQYETLPSNQYCSDKWIANFDGVSRSNDVLNVLAETEMDAADAVRVEAQAKFLRAWFHFELKRVFNNIPYITEDVEEPETVPNNVDVWPMIEEDLEFAVDNLPETWEEVGRATRYAAMAVLARVHLFQSDWTAARDLLDDIIESGKYELVDEFHDNFRTATNNNAESIFEIQYAVNDGTPDSFNGGYGDALNFPQSGDIGVCCGFHQPSQNFVNAFKVDADGLPLLDDFNETNLKHDMGVLSSSTFVPSADPVDPRLDWTVGRRGIPYLDHGIMRGADWIRDPGNGGPYLYVKNMFYESERGITTTNSGWATGVNANNYRAYRYSHVLLWRAEVAAELDDLDYALELVNEIRNRAKNSTPVMGYCTTYELPPGVDAEVDYDQPAANYLVEPYESFPSKEYARKAIRHEMRLEYGMEGHRFFDLVRWGIAAETLNAYIQKDADFRSFLQGKNFTAGKDEYWPIPITQIDIQGSDVLQQNPGY